MRSAYGLETTMPVTEADIYKLTPKGSNELKGGATGLTPHELELIVLIDGRRQVSAITKLATIGDPAEIGGLLENLLRKGFIAVASPMEETDLRLQYFFAARQSPQPSEQATASAAEEAATGASTLRDMGYYVSIARRARTRATTGPLTVLIVEDEPLVAKYLKALVEMEGLIPRLASNREEIIAELRTPPVPDLVIMDVNLPDTNGFDVLQRMKTYARFADVPVVMVTTQATRESVMKGLALGADGYITKPFEVDILVRGLRAVLGLLPPALETLGAARPPSWNENDLRGGKRR
jgi:two-component system, OmpR family, response regulator